MSSKRGRKRNDNLPPNRARDVQRAFRARRAAHLEALEHRVAELEEENNTLRAALNLPSANRPALGKGPTGKDKPKPYAPRAPTTLTSLVTSELTASGSGAPHMTISRTESPSSGSTRTHSVSPSSLSMVLNSTGQGTGLPDGAAWDDGMFPGRDRADVQPSPVSNSYPVTPVSSTTSQPPYSFSNNAQSNSRPFGMQMTQNYSHSADRPAATGEAYSESLFDRARFHFPQSAYSDNPHPPFHAQAQTSSVSLPSHRGSTGANLQSMSFAHRRSITEPQALRTALMSSLPGMMGQHTHTHSHSSSGRGPSPMSETVGHLRAAEFDVDPRMSQMNTLPS